MANEQNLVPQAHKLTVEEASKGGIASGKARAQKKTLRELAEMIGSMPVKNAETIATMKAAGFDVEQMTNDTAMLLGLQLKAQSGDPAAAKLLAEMRGQYSTRVEVEPVEPKPIIDLTQTIEGETK